MTHALRIVVVGSSTAAGQGAEPPERAWAHRYSEHLKALHPESEVVNLALGGLQTFHLMPTGHRPPPARPLPDPERNISKALTFRPNAILVQTPSNDAAANYGASEQLANFDLLLKHALQQGVPVWFFGPQPRNFLPEQRRIQRELRQAMQARYGPLFIDVWDALADADDGLLPECDSGDGAHLNNEGHARILAAVLRADILGALSRADQAPDYWTSRVPVLAEWAKHRPKTRHPRASLQRLQAWARLVRLPNLLIMVLALALPYWAVLRPAIERSGAKPALEAFPFIVLSLATVLTAAAGYVLNDYHDRTLDALNRPHRVVIGRWLSLKQARRLYGMLLLLALLSGIGLSLLLSNGLLAAVFVGASLLLSLYAWRLKCTPLAGNASVALLCGLTPLLPWIAERPHQESLASSSTGQMALTWLGVYALFAFLTNLWREQVKDLEDAAGDAAGGCQTLPVRLGIAAAQRVAVGTGLLLSALAGGLLGWQAETGATVTALAAGVIGVGLPSAMLVGLLYRASERRHFSQVSFGIKMLMLTGLLALLLIK
ncbi:MAG: UbiA family prenyltransferase [Saprospiraceae bacterium]|nr:UbiA family prenyltransferase [Saprospiraceae bacterium]MDW8229809.1 UbiA family prenyltransferase [Saprospiraceae bacterium]